MGGFHLAACAGSGVGTCMVVVAWLRAAARSRLTCGCGDEQQLWRVQFAGAVLGALRGAKLRPQPRQRPRGALASAAAWCFGAGSSLGAEAGRFLLSSSHFSFILAASDPFWFHQMLASSQVKIYSPGYIEQCAAGPSCPVRGGVGCKRCSSSVSCVG